MNRITLLLMAALIFAPVASQATVGFGETHSDVAYNSFAGLHWVHPGDGCDAGNYCFQVRRATNQYGGFKGLAGSLKMINRPEPQAKGLIIAQLSLDDKWFVYDLATEQFVAPPGTANTAVAVWAGRRLPQPEFWDAKDGGPGLSSTWKSRFENFFFGLLLLLPTLVIFAFPIFVFLAARFFRKFQASRSPRQAALAAVFGALSLGIVAFWAFIILGVHFRK